MAWSGGLAHWTEGDTAFISVAFSWKLREALRVAEYYTQRGYRVRAGGEILDKKLPQNRKILESVAEFDGDPVDALVYHNPDATIASRGCPVNCWFCIVPKVEGKTFTLIPDFTPRPILCDNNLSALPVEYQEHIIRRYQETDTPLLDANSGFEPSYFDKDTYNRWKSILRGPWRFAFDEMREQDAVRRMMAILKTENVKRKQVYVLIGNEPIASCYERVEKVREWGGEPYCQAVLPLNALDRRQYLIRHDWTSKHLIDFQRFYNAHIYHSGATLQEYCNRKYERPLFVGLAGTVREA